MRIDVDSDAWADGQIRSKRWLCMHLEETVLPVKDPVIWLVGGWYGMTAHLLLTRDRMPVRHIRSFDIDPECEKIADLINNYWVIADWKFKAFTEDCDVIDYTSYDYGDPADVVVNTAAEHFASNAWFDHVPVGTFVVVQSTDMVAPDHHYPVADLDELANRFVFTETYFSGQIEITYPERTFHRFMRMGRK